jgi:hypothetical protein
VPTFGADCSLRRFQLWSSLLFPGIKLSGKSSVALRTLTYQRLTLQMVRKMDDPPEFYAFFDSVTVKNDASVFLALACALFEEVLCIQKLLAFG